MGWAAWINMNSQGTEFDELVFVRGKVPEIVRLYAKAIEMEPTSKWCKCEWIVHPDDVDVPEESCRDCKYPRTQHMDVAENHPWDFPGCGKFKGRRMRRGDEHPECAAHTKEGFLLGFFEWSMMQRTRNRPPHCLLSTCPNTANPVFGGYCSPEHQCGVGT